jgi:hypothetical protein
MAKSASTTRPRRSSHTDCPRGPLVTDESIDRVLRTDCGHRDGHLVDDLRVLGVEHDAEAEDTPRMGGDAPIPKIGPEQVDVLGWKIVGLMWGVPAIAARVSQAEPASRHRAMKPMVDRFPRDTDAPRDLRGRHPPIAQRERVHHDFGGPGHEHTFPAKTDGNELHSAVAAGVLELVDRHGSEPCALTGVEVRILSPA